MNSERTKCCKTSFKAIHKIALDPQCIWYCQKRHSSWRVLELRGQSSCTFASKIFDSSLHNLDSSCIHFELNNRFLCFSLLANCSCNHLVRSTTNIDYFNSHFCWLQAQERFRNRSNFEFYSPWCRFRHYWMSNCSKTCWCCKLYLIRLLNYMKSLNLCSTLYYQ